MKCKSFVKFVSARKVGSGEPYQKAVKIYPRYFEKLGRFVPNPDMIECDGELEVHISAEEEGECACSSYATLKLEYKCKKCGGTFFYELPQTAEEISSFVQKVIEELPEEERDKMLQDKLVKEIEYQKRIDKDVARMRKDLKKVQDAG